MKLAYKRKGTTVNEKKEAKEAAKNADGEVDPARVIGIIPEESDSYRTDRESSEYNEKNDSLRNSLMQQNDETNTAIMFAPSYNSPYYSKSKQEISMEQES